MLLEIIQTNGNGLGPAGGAWIALLPQGARFSVLVLISREIMVFLTLLLSKTWKLQSEKNLWWL